MNRERIAALIGQDQMTIVNAMEKIDANASGILFVVDAEEQLCGCITDGDIRRWLIKTGDLNAVIKCAMTAEPKYLLESERQNAEKVMRESAITALPILDQKQHIEDIIMRSDVADRHSLSEKEQITDVPVVIMAGGKGTRLYPYTKILPKPLIPIGEIPIIERIINCFTEYGIKQFYMTVNYKKEMIKSYFADINPQYMIQYVEEDQPLGTGGSLKLIRKKFEKPLFVINADVLILADYRDIYEYHVKSGNLITMVSAVKNITVPYGVLHTRENGELVSMEEKPQLSYFINSGMYIINPEIISQIPENTLFHMTNLVENVMKTGGKVGAYPVSEDSFFDMGEFGEMRRMEEKLHLKE